MKDYTGPGFVGNTLDSVAKAIAPSTYTPASIVDKAGVHIGNIPSWVIQSSAPFKLAIVRGMNVRASQLSNYPPRYNGAPSQDLLMIRRNRDTGEVSLDPLRSGLIPYWCTDPKGGRKPINAKAETVARLPMFRDAYARRRCILPVDGFFEWKAIKGLKAKQPFARCGTARHSELPAFGKIGKSRRAGNGSAPLQSSPCRLTNSWRRSIIGCQQFLGAPIMSGGLVTKATLTTCCGRSHRN